jgi:hypothetical protein
MVLMKGVQIGTLYKLLGSVESNGCNNIIVPKVDSNSTRLELTQAESIQTTRQVIINSTRPCYGMRGWDTLEKKEFELCIKKVWSNRLS